MTECGRANKTLIRIPGPHDLNQLGRHSGGFVGDVVDQHDHIQRVEQPGQDVACKPAISLARDALNP